MEQTEIASVQNERKKKITQWAKEEIGAWMPVILAEFDNIMLAGTNVTRATLNNQDFINKMDIRIGDTITVRKSGDIIPQITSVLYERRPDRTAPYIIDHCPTCGAPVESRNGSVDLFCTNPNCAAQTVKMNQDTKTLLDEAKALIDEYCWVEFGNKTGADYSDLSAVGIGCTLDVDHEVQAQVNLVEYCIDTIVDDVLVRSEHYDDLGDLVKNGLLGLCGFSVRMDWKFTRGYQNRSQSAVKDEVLAKCKKNGLPVPTQVVETHRGLQAVWYLKERKPANFLPVWNVLQNCLCEMFSQFGAASVRLGVCETVDLPVGGLKLLHSQKQPTSWDAMYNALRRAYYMRTYSAIAAKYYPDPAHRPTWYHTQQLMSNGTLQVPADEQPKPFISNAPSYQWLRSGGWDEDLIVDAEPAVTTKCGRPMSSARASQTVGMMPAYYGEVADDLLKLVRLRKGEFSAEMQQRLLFYIYVYSVLKISCKRDGDAPAVEAVRAADALMRHPMTPEMLEQRIAGLRASVRYDRTSVSKKRVISDLQITVAEQKQLKRLLGHEEDLRRKSKSGMLRSERDTALDTAIVEMLAQGKLHREIGEKLGMARESVTRRIRRNNLLREVQEARNALAKEQARAKKAEKTKNKDDDDKNGGARAGGTQAASKPQKKSSRKPLSESRWLAVLAVQRVRRAKERLARKCSICIRNLAKRYYRLNAARVEWISGVSAAKSLCATPFPQLC